jgi:hypothetical protein
MNGSSTGRTDRSTSIRDRYAAQEALAQQAQARASDPGYVLVGPSARTWLRDPLTGGPATAVSEAEHRAVHELLDREVLDMAEPEWVTGADGSADVHTRVGPTEDIGNDFAEDGPMIDSGLSYSAEQAAHELAGPHRSLDEARVLVSSYLDDVSERVGVPVHRWSLDETDLAEIESGRTGAVSAAVVGDGSATARDAGPAVVGLACPECKEEVLTGPPTALVPYEAHGLEEPGYSHLDGEPLCPVMGPRGYQPADPVEIHGDVPSPARRRGAGGPVVDGPAGEPAGAVGHAHGAVAVEQAHHAVVEVGEGSDAGDESRREQLARWSTQDDAQDSRTSAVSNGDGSTAGEW